MKKVVLDRKSMQRALFVIGGVLLNVCLAYLTKRLEIPLYLDTIGTIAVTFVGGALPGIVTAVMTNVLCIPFNDMAVYYNVLSVLIALCAVHFARKNAFGSLKKLILLILAATLIGGGGGSIMQWVLLGGPQFRAVEDLVKTITQATGLSAFFVFLVCNLLLNLVDKSIAIIAAGLIRNLVPQAIREDIYNSGWKQTPLSKEEIRELSTQTRSKHSIQGRVTTLLIVMSLTLVGVMCYISLHLYYLNIKANSVENAWNAARFVSEVLDTSRIDDFVKYGRQAEGYEETEQLLYRIRENAANVTYLYVVRILDNGCQFIFDLNDENSDAEDSALLFQPGEMAAFEEAFEPYLGDLFAGRKVGPIDSDSALWSRLQTVYYPVIDENGRCVCYVGADVSLDGMNRYAAEFLMRVIIVMIGFIFLALAYGFWKNNYYVTYPVNTITASANRFLKDLSSDTDLSVLNDDVRRLRMENIRTEDELQELYLSICQLTGNVTEQLWEIRHYSEAVEKMQNGLIITMADMVENRDSDTGAHIQKTSAYVQIIVNGLKKKNYYTEKLTPKFMTDCVMSAPLHDVGKINIPDAVLNKPGRLTPEEFEIMKTHTTAGRIIMEKAISTVSGENYLKEARNMAAYHHEKWDGSGYPEGLHGEVIPLSARIMAVADVFDALASKRVYKPAFPFDKAVGIIRDGAGKEFDPKVVEVFLDSLDDVKKVLRQYKEYEGEVL